jgi:hypothetical protein
MKKISKNVLLLVVLSLACVVCGQDYPLRYAQEFRVRDGLANFFGKLQAGKEVRIAYLGGSITAQAGWRLKTLKWFQEQYPNAKILAKRNEKIDDPSRYDDTAWYAGAILLIGEIVE